MKTCKHCFKGGCFGRYWEGNHHKITSHQKPFLLFSIKRHDHQYWSRVYIITSISSVRDIGRDNIIVVGWNEILPHFAGMPAVLKTLHKLLCAITNEKFHPVITVKLCYLKRQLLSTCLQENTFYPVIISREIITPGSCK